MAKKDVLGNLLEVGDAIVFGVDNGSSLVKAQITKLTEKKVHFLCCYGNGHRDYNRVVKICAGEGFEHG